MDIGAADDLFAGVVGFNPTSVWDDGDAVTAAIEALPTRRRAHMAAARADDTDDGATATGRSGGAVGAPADVGVFHPASVWGVMMMRSRQRHRFLVGLLQMLIWLLAA